MYRKVSLTSRFASHKFTHHHLLYSLKFFFMIKFFFLFLLSCMIAGSVSAQPPEVLGVKKYINQNAGNIISEFSSFLSIPNVAADPGGQQKNAAFIMEMM